MTKEFKGMPFSDGKGNFGIVAETGKLRARDPQEIVKEKLANPISTNEGTE